MESPEQVLLEEEELKRTLKDIDSDFDLNSLPDVQEVMKKFPNFDQLPYHDQERIKCKVSFEYFASKYIKILNVKKGLVNFFLYGYQRRCVKHFGKHRFNIVSKFRQGGLTTLAVLWSLWRCMFKKHQTILILSKTDREAIEAGKIAKTALENMKFEDEWIAPELLEDSKHQMVFKETKSRIMCHTPEAARGKTAGYIIIDEAAFIKNMEEHWKAMYPVVATGGNVIVISTVNGRGNWYEKQYTQALRGKNDFHIIDLDYKEHPLYKQAGWEEQARANLGKKEFAQEFGRSFLESGETYIDSEILTELSEQTRYSIPVRKLYPEWDTDGEIDDKLSTFGEKMDWEIGALHIFQEPIDGREYIIGADVAEGVGDGGDKSAFHVIDMTSLEQVAEFCSNNVPPHVFAQILSIVGNYYNIALLAVENQGPGLAVLDKLQHTLYYENIYFYQIRNREKAGVTNNRTTRPLILESMQNYLQNRFVKVRSNRLVSELDTFIFNKQAKRAEASKGHNDDLTMAFAIALHVRDKSMRDVPMGVDIPENVIDSVKEKNLEKLKEEMERGAPIDLISEDDMSNKVPWEEKDVLPGVDFDIKRPNDGLLREFGW